MTSSLSAIGSSTAAFRQIVGHGNAYTRRRRLPLGRCIATQYSAQDGFRNGQRTASPPTTQHPDRALAWLRAAIVIAKSP
jgi:hypothetical protein